MVPGYVPLPNCYPSTVRWLSWAKIWYETTQTPHTGRLAQNPLLWSGPWALPTFCATRPVRGSSTRSPAPGHQEPVSPSTTRAKNCIVNNAIFLSVVPLPTKWGGKVCRRAQHRKPVQLNKKLKSDRPRQAMARRGLDFLPNKKIAAWSVKDCPMLFFYWRIKIINMRNSILIILNKR